MKQPGTRVDNGSNLDGTSPLSDYPEIGPFTLDREIMLCPMPNGGWVVRQRGERPELMGADLGAYTTANEMLEVLKRHL